MVTDVVYDRFGIDLQGNKSETEDDKAKVNATVGIGNGDVGQVDEVYYGNVYAGSLIQCLISELPMPRYLWEGFQE